VREAADDDLFTECWAPVLKMADLGGHLAEDRCGACAACRLAAALDAASVGGEEGET
jgi:hypothetical protein